MDTSNSLIMERRNGRKVCGIKSGVIWFRRQTSLLSFLFRPRDMVVINIEATRPTEGADEYDASPDVMVSWFDRPFSIDTLAGRTITIPFSYDSSARDHVTAFHYYEHLEMNETTVRLLERDGDRFHVQITGVADDPSPQEPGATMRISVDTIVTYEPRD